MAAKDESLDTEDVLELDDDLDDIDADEDDEEIVLAAEEDPDEASLEELLAARTASRRGADEADDDEDDIMALASEPDIPVLEPLPTTVVPVKDQQEFVCTNCHLVKARVQLSDEDRGLCRDCI